MSNGRSNVGVAGTALMSKLSLLSEATRREIDHWVAKFPSGRQRSACIAALRAAQRGMVAGGRWSTPYRWAAFTVQGEWR